MKIIIIARNFYIYYLTVQFYKTNNNKYAIITPSLNRKGWQIMEILTVKELQKYMKISKNTAYELCKRCDFPAVKVGNAVRIPKEELDKWLVKNSYK